MKKISIILCFILIFTLCGDSMNCQAESLGKREVEELMQNATVVASDESETIPSAKADFRLINGAQLRAGAIPDDYPSYYSQVQALYFLVNYYRAIAKSYAHTTYYYMDNTGNYQKDWPIDYIYAKVRAYSSAAILLGSEAQEERNASFVSAYTDNVHTSNGTVYGNHTYQCSGYQTVHVETKVIY